MREFLILVAIGLGTYSMRAAFLVTARAEPPAAMTRLLPYVGPAVLAAITLPALLAPRGTVSATESLPALGAAPCPGCSGGAPQACRSPCSAGSARGGSRAHC